MIKANFNTYNNYVTDSLYQWDLNQDLIINGLNLSVAPEIHFANANMDRAIVRQSTLSSGVVTVQIPNSLLQEALTIKAYVGVYEDDTFKVIETIEIPVIAKVRPSDYTISDSDEEIYSFNKLENELANAKKEIEDLGDANLEELRSFVNQSTEALNTRIDNIIAHNNDTEGNTELVDMKVDYEGNTHGSAGEAVRYQNSKLSRKIEGLEKNLTDNETFITNTFEDVTKATSSANGSWWCNDILYTPRYIKNISLFSNSDSEINVAIAILKADNKEVLEIFETSGISKITVNVDKYVGYDFYIAVKGEGIAFLGGAYKETDSIYRTAFDCSYMSFNNDLKIGDTVNISFQELSIFDQTYCIAVEVETYSVKRSVTNLYNKSQLNYTKNKMYVFGDSITAGHPYESINGIHWWEIVGRTLGFDVTCGAYTGAGFVYESGGYNGAIFADSVDYSNYDVVICALGTNDYGQNIPIGNETDMYDISSEENTMYGAINYVIDKIMTSNPAITLIFALPIDRKRVGNTTNLDSCWTVENSIGNTLNDYCDAIINRCNYFGLPYIDRHNSVINRKTMPTLLVDQVHPTIEGYKIIGQEMSARVGAIIRPYILE